MGLAHITSLIRRAVRLRRDVAPLKLLTYVWNRISEKKRGFNFVGFSVRPGSGSRKVSGLFDK